MRLLLQSWFLISLLILLSGGMATGWLMTDDWRRMTFGQIHPGTVTVLILFLMSFSLDSGRLRDSFRSPGPILWGMLINIGILPLMAWPMTKCFTLPDFSLGLMIAAAVPCTLATASVSTRQAGGNDAVSLLVTLLTNFVSVVLTPLWLNWTIAIDANMDPIPVILNLALTVLLPTIAGQLARILRWLRHFATVHRMNVSIAAQCLVLLVVTKAAVEAGGQLRTQSVWPGGIEFLGLIAACAGLHLVAMMIADKGSRWLQFPRIDRIATIFAGSQKTLPVGLLLAATPAVTGGRDLPFVTFPILLFHALQLLMDSAIADQIHKRS